MDIYFIKMYLKLLYLGVKGKELLIVPAVIRLAGVVPSF